MMTISSQGGIRSDGKSARFDGRKYFCFGVTPEIETYRCMAQAKGLLTGGKSMSDLSWQIQPHGKSDLPIMKTRVDRVACVALPRGGRGLIFTLNH